MATLLGALAWIVVLLVALLLYTPLRGLAGRRARWAHLAREVDERFSKGYEELVFSGGQSLRALFHVPNLSPRKREAAGITQHLAFNAGAGYRAYLQQWDAAAHYLRLKEAVAAVGERIDRDELLRVVRLYEASVNDYRSLMAVFRSMLNLRRDFQRLHSDAPYDPLQGAPAALFERLQGFEAELDRINNRLRAQARIAVTFEGSPPTA